MSEYIMNEAEKTILEVVIGVMDGLIEEKEKDLSSEHFSVRYSSEMDVKSIERVKEILKERIEEHYE